MHGLFQGILGDDLLAANRVWGLGASRGSEYGYGNKCICTEHFKDPITHSPFSTSKATSHTLKDTLKSASYGVYPWPTWVHYSKGLPEPKTV